MTFPRDAWIPRRLLADLPLNGELDTMTGALKSMAGHLATVLPPLAPPAGSGRAQTFPRWLLPVTDNRIGKERTGPDLDERSFSIQYVAEIQPVIQIQAISSDRFIRLSPLPPPCR